METTSPKHIAIVCFGFADESLHKQPWATVHAIAEGLTEHGIHITLVTDASLPPKNTSYKIQTVPKLFSRTRPTPTLLNTIISLAPDHALIIAGPHELLTPERFSMLPCRCSVILAAQRFRLRDLLRIDWQAWRYEWKLLALPLLNALTPPAALRWGWGQSQLEQAIYFSEDARIAYTALGLPPGPVIEPRIPHPLTPRTPLAESTTPQLCYFGPPLALRGSEEVLSAFNSMRSRGIPAHLSLLMRVDDGLTTARNTKLREQVFRSPYATDITYDDTRLNADKLNEKLAKADIFILPFFLTVSDVPLVIPEAALSGKPVITFDTAGIRDLAPHFPNLVVCTPTQLGETLEKVTRNPEHYSTSYSPEELDAWKDTKIITSELAARLNQAPAEQDMQWLSKLRALYLSGIDGGGKSTLIGRLREQMDTCQQPCHYVWSRYRNYLSKPFLGLMRLTKYSVMEKHGDIRIRYHHFHSPWLAWPFLAMQWVDNALDILLRTYTLRRDRPILSDRCTIDTLVDLAVATGRSDFIFGNYGKSLAKIFPNPHQKIIISCDKETIISRRPDVAIDKNLDLRLTLYRTLAERWNIPLLENNGSIDEALNAVKAISTGRSPIKQLPAPSTGSRAA